MMFLSNKKHSTFLACFSPPVMIMTLVIEFGLALYVLLRYKLRKSTSIIILILILLGMFQLAEYQVCGGNQALFWSKAGFVTITLLPALGVSLIHTVASKKLTQTYNLLAWLMATFFVVVILITPIRELSPVCNGNYVIFKYAHPNNFSIIAYTAYYYGLLLSGIYAAYIWAKAIKSNRRRALYLIITSYLVFIIPTFIINVVLPYTVMAIPSILCGFAVFAALLFALAVNPQVGKKR